MSEETRVSININFRSIDPDRIREITTWCLDLSHKFSLYVDDEIKEFLEEDEAPAPPVVYYQSNLVEEIKKDLPTDAEGLHDDGPKDLGLPSTSLLGQGKTPQCGFGTDKDYVGILTTGEARRQMIGSFADHEDFKGG